MGHEFGGEWTDAKLDCLEGYLRAYRQIFAVNERAKHFRTWYVDAFAGTGERVVKSDENPNQALFDDFYENEEVARYRRGSAEIALALDSPFDQYLFIEKSADFAKQLRQHVEKKPTSISARVEILKGDANVRLIEWVAQRDWKKDRAVVFLDPYGLQVDWKTIQILGATQGVDLWYLFPMGMGPMRMIPREGEVPTSWSVKLDRLFGTHDWSERFYKKSQQGSLFDEAPKLETAVSPAVVSAFVKERLEQCFYKVADGLVLCNSRSFPMYLLCFAASNERGSGPALRIANSILGKD